MSLTVYVVDDSPLVRERIEALLMRIDGARIVGHAEDADEAIARIPALLPQVVILDQRLARGSGFDVLRALRELAPQVAVYLLSNFASPAYRRIAERLGARGYFDKTQEFGQLMDLLAQRAAE